MRCGLYLLLAGCDSIFGLHDVTVLDVAAPPDASVIGHPVNGSIYAVFVHNTPSGTPTLETLFLPPSSLILSLVTDTESTPLSVDPGTGAFSFIPTESPYRLVFQAVAAEPSTYEVVMASTTLDIQLPILTRPTVTPVTNGSIEFGVMPNFSAPVMVTSGIWHPSIKMLFGGPFAWTGPYPQTFDATQGDRVFAIEYANYPYATTYPTTNQISTYAIGSTTAMISAAGPNPVIMSTPMPATPSCITINARFQQGLGRLGPYIVPGDVQGHEWAVGAFASDLIAPTYPGILIADNQLVAADGGQAMVFNPFGLPTLALSAVATERQYHSTTYGTSITEWHEIVVPPMGGCTTTETFDTKEAAIAGIPTFGGKQLASDDVVVDRGSDAIVELDWQPSAQQVDAWSVELDEMGDAASPVPLHTIITTSTTLKIASSLFVRNKAYSFKITGFAGLPKGGEGNLNTATFPFAITSVVTHPFSVL